MSTVTTEQLTAIILGSQHLEDNVKQVLAQLVRDNDVKTQQIAKLESDVRHLNIKVNELERYQSKDCLIFRNLPIGSNGSILEDTLAFIRDIMYVDIQACDLKACHALGPVVTDKPPAIIAKFVYFDQKERIWSRKRFLKNFVNPNNNSPVYIHERLSKSDKALKELAETNGMYVTTNNSAPVLHIQQDNGTVRPHVINSEQDVMELKHKATKNRQRSRPISNLTNERADGVNTRLEKHHIPPLTKQSILPPCTPLTTSIPALKRGRNHFSPPSQIDEENILAELKARKDNDNDLLDYVKGLLSGTPTAKQQSLQLDEDIFRVEREKQMEAVETL